MSAKENSTVPIMIIDDHPIVRQGLKMIIERETRFKICAEASNATDAIRIMADAAPEIAIVDISLEGTTNGIELVKAIRERYPSIVCIVLSMYDESLYAERAIRAGAKGYVMKKEADENIINAINMVLAGELYLSESMSKTIVNKLIHGPSDKEILPENTLSDRELEIFMMIGNGVSMKDVAKQLNLSLNTVETHRRHIREKMLFKDNNELVKYAVQWVFLNNR